MAGLRLATASQGHRPLALRAEAAGRIGADSIRNSCLRSAVVCGSPALRPEQNTRAFFARSPAPGLYTGFQVVSLLSVVTTAALLLPFKMPQGLGIDQVRQPALELQADRR